MAATKSGLVAIGSPSLLREKEEGAGSSPNPRRSSAGSSSTPEAPPLAAEPSGPNASVPEAVPPPLPASVTLRLLCHPVRLRGVPSLAQPNPFIPAAPDGSRPGPETFRQRFRQFRYQDAAGPRDAFRQLRELSRQWLRPDIRTKEQIVEMLVQEQLFAILPEAARGRGVRRRTDVRFTG